MATVATAANTPWSLNTVKAYVGAASSAVDDAVLIQIANAVASELERVTKRIYTTRTIVNERQDNLRGWTRAVFTRYRPLRSLTALKIKYYPYDAWTAVNITTANNGPDVEVDYPKGRLFLRQWWFPRGYNAIEIAYTAGYGAQDSGFPAENVTTIDGESVMLHNGMADAYQIGLDMCKVVYSIKSANAQAASSIQIGPNGSFVIRPDWPIHIKMGLQNLTAPVAS